MTEDENQDDYSVDAVLSYLNTCFDQSITEITHTDENGNTATIWPLSSGFISFCQ